MFTTDDVLTALRDNGYSIVSRTGREYEVRLAGQQWTKSLMLDDAAIQGFTTRFGSDGQILWPEANSETGAYRLLLANIFEGLETADEVQVTPDRVLFIRASPA